MNIYDLDKLEYENFDKNFIALGNFDGLHIAHLRVLSNAINLSKENGLNSSVLLFKEHTLNNLQNSNTKILTNLNQKLDILREIPIDNVFLISFEKIRNLSPEEFIKTFLIDNLNVRGISVGFDYHFGKNALGNIDSLSEFSKKYGIFTQITDRYEIEGQTVSSTLIKNLIKNDEIEKAEYFLGREYWLQGKVITGKKLGSKLGFPTANIKLKSNYQLFSDGVYYTKIRICGNEYKAATSLGKNLTFDEDETKIEAHIIDFDKDIYFDDIEIRFVKRLRDMNKFSNSELLTEQVNSDIEFVKRQY